jgi:hypothetical protein
LREPPPPRALRRVSNCRNDERRACCPAHLVGRECGGRCGPPSTDPPASQVPPQIQQLVSSSRTCLLARSCAHSRRATACSGRRAPPLGLPQTRQGLRRRFMCSAYRLRSVRVNRRGINARIDPAARALDEHLAADRVLAPRLNPLALLRKRAIVRPPARLALAPRSAGRSLGRRRRRTVDFRSRGAETRAATARTSAAS